jgi:hypothetical protein
LARYLIDNNKGEWVDPETMAKVQHLKIWNPVTDAPGFGDTDEEEEKEEDNQRGIILKANDETRRQEDDEEDP